MGRSPILEQIGIEDFRGAANPRWNRFFASDSGSPQLTRKILPLLLSVPPRPQHSLGGRRPYDKSQVALVSARFGFCPLWFLLAPAFACPGFCVRAERQAKLRENIRSLAHRCAPVRNDIQRRLRRDHGLPRAQPISASGSADFNGENTPGPPTLWRSRPRIRGPVKKSILEIDPARSVASPHVEVLRADVRRPFQSEMPPFLRQVRKAVSLHQAE